MHSLSILNACEYGIHANVFMQTSQRLTTIKKLKKKTLYASFCSSFLIWRLNRLATAYNLKKESVSSPDPELPVQSEYIGICIKKVTFTPKIYLPHSAHSYRKTQNFVVPRPTSLERVSSSHKDGKTLIIIYTIRLSFTYSKYYYVIISRETHESEIIVFFSLSSSLINKIKMKSSRS